MFKRKTKTRKSPARTASNLFHGVEIVPGDNACPAVADLANERYLSEDAPRLPLDACAHPHECACRYQHYADRRTELRRESDEGLPPRDFPDEKRRRVGRRITDG